MADPITIEPGVIPLGYSYVLGQERFHADGDPGGDYLTAYKDRLAVGALFSFPAGEGYQDDTPGLPSFADVVAQLAGQGPIPQDVEVPPSTNGLWSNPNITKERHVYFYGWRNPQNAADGSITFSFNAANRLASDLVLMMQISGFDSKQNKWILPQRAGEGFLAGATIPIVFWYLKPGSTLAEGIWTHQISFGETTDTAGFMNEFMAILGAAVSFVGAEAGDPALGGQVTGQILKLLIDEIPVIVNAALTGNSSGLLSSFENVAISLASDVAASAQVRTALAKSDWGANLLSFADTSQKTIGNVIGAAQNEIGQVTALLGQGVSLAVADVQNISGCATGYVNTVLSQIKTGIPVVGAAGQVGGMALKLQNVITSQRIFTDGNAAIGLLDDQTAKDALAAYDFSNTVPSPAALAKIMGVVAANTQAALDDMIGDGAIDRARAVFGATSRADVPIGSVGGTFATHKYGQAGQYMLDVNAPLYFMDLALAAPDAATIASLAQGIPWYAKEYFLMGATIRAANLAQADAPAFRSYYATIAPRPGGGLAGAYFLAPVEKSIFSGMTFISH